MAPGLIASILAIAVGAILDFAVTTNTDQHGFDVHTVGVILMIVGAAGAVLSIIAYLVGWMPQHRRTVVDDGRGNISRRDETYL